MPRPANAKDALLAWAYRYVWQDRPRGLEGEFIFACRYAVPDIDSMVVDLPDTPLEAVRRARETERRLVEMDPDG